MKTLSAVCIASLALLIVVPHAAAEIIAGPLTNPANGHDYYLLAPNSWNMAQAEAESLGGTLAVIDNEEEQKWVFSTFGGYGGVNRDLWIGLHKNAQNEYAWVNGAPANYLNWGPHQPDNAGGLENAVHIWMPGPDVQGLWNDSAKVSIFPSVVELPGKADAVVLTKAARGLIGTWYEGGNAQRPCWITATEQALFVIPANRLASRAGVNADGSLLFAASQRGHGGGMMPHRFGGEVTSPTGLLGEVIKDRILWSNGTWWSRKPVDEVHRETTAVRN